MEREPAKAARRNETWPRADYVILIMSGRLAEKRAEMVRDANLRERIRDLLKDLFTNMPLGASTKDFNKLLNNASDLLAQTDYEALMGQELE